MQNVLTCYEKSLFSAARSSTCFQDNSTAQTVSLEKLYLYKLVVAGLVCINNTLILTCPNL